MRRTRSATLPISIMALMSFAHSMKVRRRCLPGVQVRLVSRTQQRCRPLTRDDSYRSSDFAQVVLGEALDQTLEQGRLADLGRGKRAISSLHWTT